MRATWLAIFVAISAPVHAAGENFWVGSWTFGGEVEIGGGPHGSHISSTAVAEGRLLIHCAADEFTLRLALATPHTLLVRRRGVDLGVYLDPKPGLSGGFGGTLLISADDEGDGQILRRSLSAKDVGVLAGARRQISIAVDSPGIPLLVFPALGTGSAINSLRAGCHYGDDF
jgi:hypothetical protein